MHEVRTNQDVDSQNWDSGKPLGWVVTIDGDWPYYSPDERRDIVIEVRAEEMRAEESRLEHA